MVQIQVKSQIMLKKLRHHQSETTCNVGIVKPGRTKHKNTWKHDEKLRLEQRMGPYAFMEKITNKLR